MLPRQDDNRGSITHLHGEGPRRGAMAGAFVFTLFSCRNGSCDLLQAVAWRVVRGSPHRFHLPMSQRTNRRRLQGQPAGQLPVSPVSCDPRTAEELLLHDVGLGLCAHFPTQLLPSHRLRAALTTSLMLRLSNS
jgi:hypothetical protein